MTPEERRVVVAWLASNVGRTTNRDALEAAVLRAVEFPGPRWADIGDAWGWAFDLAEQYGDEVSPEEVAAFVRRMETDPPPEHRGVVCAACLRAGNASPRTARLEGSPADRYAARWANWESMETCSGVWVCPDCWGNRRFADLERLLGPARRVFVEGPTLISPRYRRRDPTYLPEGEESFDSLAEFIAAVETHPTRIPSSSPETQEDVLQPRDHDWTAPAGMPTTEEIARRYKDTEIIRELGKGVTSVVYEVRRPSTGLRHALKVLKSALTRSAGMQARFRREAEALLRLNHPNIVRLVEFENLSNTWCFLLELVEGVTLNDSISQGGALRPVRALEIAEQICDGLAHAHRQKIVHRDIKAENIYLRHDGKVKIGDFGLAKMSESMHGVRPLTAQDGVMGTPIYMAPEQRTAAHDVDGRADIYSLGVLLYEMLTGRLPREPGPDEGVRLDPVDPRLDRILAMATATDPDDRYAIAEDFKRALMAARLGM